VKELVDNNAQSQLSNCTWHNRFMIKEGKFENYSKYSFSTEYYQDCLSKDAVFKNADQYMPDKLYAIPQAVWDEFISKLANQEVVTALGLSQHRHLWQSYNEICQEEDPRVRNRLARAINTYHFLDGLISPDSNRKLADNQTTILSAFNVDIPHVSKNFYNKFAHSSLSDLLFFSSHLVVPKAMDEHNKTVNKQKMDEIVAALPCSKKSPHEFAEMISCGRKIDTIFCWSNGSSPIKANVFYQYRNRFSHFAQLPQIDDNLILDYVRELVSNLIYPEAIRRHAAGEGLMPYDLFNALREMFINYLTDKITLGNINALQERWHRNITVISANKPDELIQHEWHEFFHPIKINDVTFTCLTTSKTLKVEGEEMKHCVGGYAHQCLTGNYHIVKAQSEQGECATLEIKIDKEKSISQTVELKQIRRYRNKEPDNAIMLASQQLIEKIKSGLVSTNSRLGSITANNLKKDLPAIHNHYPYHFHDKNVQEKIYQAYKTTNTLPSFMMANSYVECLEKNPKLMELMNDLLQRHAVSTPASSGRRFA
jgi:hypothetical protein